MGRRGENVGRVCVVGGGNAAQAMAALFPHLGVPCNVFAPHGDEAERLCRALEDQGYIQADFAPHNDPSGTVRGRPERVSNRAEEVVPGCDVVLLPLPSFAYRPVFREIGPHLKPGTLVGATPGQGGVEWVARELLGERFGGILLFSILPMPFNCRVVEFGKRVDVQVLKRRYRVAALPHEGLAPARRAVEALFGETEAIGHFLATALYPANAVIHPARLYTLIGGWRQGEVLAENPLFYEDMTGEAVAWMARINGEACQVGDRLRDAGMSGLEVPKIEDYLMGYVYREPGRDLRRFFATHPGFRGFRCPFTRVDGGWVPDFSNRYFTEDIPYGLCVYKGLAQLAGVDTPAIDEILGWAQGHMGKSYLESDRLQGPDVGQTGAPQAYGIHDLEALAACYRSGPRRT